MTFLVVAGPDSSLEIPVCSINVWVDMWVEIGVVWVDKICVGGILKCNLLTQKFVPFRQLRRGRRKVVVTHFF